MISFPDPETVFGRKRQVHAITAWNPSPRFSGPAQQGMRLWSNKLAELKKSATEKEEVYTWFGKVSVSGALGMEDPEKWASAFNHQIQVSRVKKRGPETHVYMYCGYYPDERPASLHVGKVEKVVAYQDAVFGDPEEEAHTPMDFYQDLIARYGSRHNKKILIPYWFKISDIREIGKSHLENLEYLTFQDSGNAEYKSFFPVNFNSPFPVYEKKERSFFDQKELRHYDLPGWWEEVNKNVIVLHDSLSDDTDSSSPSNVVVVPRKASKMAESVSAILARGEEILFIDPYFWPEQKIWREPFKAFVSQAAKGSGRKYLEYHTCEKRNTCSFAELSRSCRKHLPKLLPRNWKMSVFRWKENSQPFHARYILTKQAGVLFEHGLSEGDGDCGDQLLVLLTPQVGAERWKMFQAPSGAYTLVDKVPPIYGEK